MKPRDKNGNLLCIRKDCRKMLDRPDKYIVTKKGNALCKCCAEEERLRKLNGALSF